MAQALAGLLDGAVQDGAAPATITGEVPAGGTAVAAGMAAITPATTKAIGTTTIGTTAMAAKARRRGHNDNDNDHGKNDNKKMQAREGDHDNDNDNNNNKNNNNNNNNGNGGNNQKGSGRLFLNQQQ